MFQIFIFNISEMICNLLGLHKTPSETLKKFGFLPTQLNKCEILFLWESLSQFKKCGRKVL